MFAPAIPGLNDHEVEAVLEALAEAWARRFALWRRPGGFGPIRQAWLERVRQLLAAYLQQPAESPLVGTWLQRLTLRRREKEAR